MLTRRPCVVNWLPDGLALIGGLVELVNLLLGELRGELTGGTLDGAAEQHECSRNPVAEV